MIPVLFVLLVVWAGSGAVASIKTARASTPGAPAAKGASTTGTTAAPTATALADVTFGQWQRAAYGRWKNKL